MHYLLAFACCFLMAYCVICFLPNDNFQKTEAMASVINIECRFLTLLIYHIANPNSKTENHTCIKTSFYDVNTSKNMASKCRHSMTLARHINKFNRLQQKVGASMVGIIIMVSKLDQPATITATATKMLTITGTVITTTTSCG